MIPFIKSTAQFVGVVVMLWVMLWALAIAFDRLMGRLKRIPYAYEAACMLISFFAGAMITFGLMARA